jgi:hypothetical protein
MNLSKMRSQNIKFLILILSGLAFSSCSTVKMISCNELEQWDRPEQIILKDDTKIYTYSNYTKFRVSADSLCMARTNESSPVKCIPCDDIRYMAVTKYAKLKPGLIISACVVGGIFLLIPW